VTSSESHVGAGREFRPDVTVAAVVEREGRFLLVEEVVHGRRVLNQPAGHLDAGESLLDAVVRETREETGWLVRPTALVAVYQWTSPRDGRSILRFTFVAEALAELPGAVLDVGVERAWWLDEHELAAHPVPARSPLVARSIADYRRGLRADLAVLADLARAG
jgi:8-oxo-dGTP pyrophosphatase MutT (NUDIX family)